MCKMILHKINTTSICSESLYGPQFWGLVMEQTQQTSMQWSVERAKRSLSTRCSKRLSCFGTWFFWFGQVTIFLAVQCEMTLRHVCACLLQLLGHILGYNLLQANWKHRIWEIGWPLHETKQSQARNGVEKWLSAEGGVEEYMVKTMRGEVKKGQVKLSLSRSYVYTTKSIESQEMSRDWIPKLLVQQKSSNMLKHILYPCTKVLRVARFSATILARLGDLCTRVWSKGVGPEAVLSGRQCSG